MTLTELFVSIANAIRAKTGETAAIKAEDFPAAIEAIQTGGGGFGTENSDIVLEVQKKVLTTYANETTYSNEEFVLLDVYPKTNGTVTVTYGNLTKTIIDTSGAEEPNAQQVFFGTFNGVTDDVETPATGTLTIKGDCRGVGNGFYVSDSKLPALPSTFITNVITLGYVEILPENAIYKCENIQIKIPSSVTKIGRSSFDECVNLNTLSIPYNVQDIGFCVAGKYEEYTGNDVTFYNCNALKNINVSENNRYYSAENGVLFNKDKTLLIAAPGISGIYTIPSTVVEIANSAFYGVDITEITVPASVKTIYTNAFGAGTLVKATFLSTTPPTLASDAFKLSGILLEIYVPTGCADVYKSAAGWSDYAGRIKEVS